MRKLSSYKRTAIIGALVEESSVNATARMCVVSSLTVLRLLAEVGRARPSLDVAGARPHGD